MEEFSEAMKNRSLRTIRAELEFLVDSKYITNQQFNAIVNHLPLQTSLHPPLPPAQEVPASPMANLSSVADLKISEPEPAKKKVGYYADSAIPNPPPPAYPSAPPAPIVLAHATALYQYNAQDAGDLALTQNDRIEVTEYMNAEWWKGRNERTGEEGIFPRSYVKVVEEKGPTMPLAPQASNYGNMPLDVSQGATSGTPQEPSKHQEMGKKFGKKLGNAAIFGAGATIGSNIVNGIF
ncbi:SH3 domain protein [Lepidopterella palustris CBS 459.81]|uniref:SH3 domain protein n=1 Tax=Lepidopterella palustris CBS 459.81 TaxID=1314670 RepID=A0A8E2JD54_9PEZI|nr:SH3 domain protein [Lepidopterella palustris CBS 459.81]